ncbi:hypothetical protein BGZ83_008452 [Gryganskiella cystojenkinii]|nr:hypothetical protein BGZ83_008452 [Gryganskiella cystojenkinii]
MITAVVVSPGAIPDFVHPPVPGESHDFYGDAHLDTIKLPLPPVIEPPRSRPGLPSSYPLSGSSDPLSAQGEHSNFSSSNYNPLETGASAAVGNESPLHEQNSGASIVAEGEGRAGRTTTTITNHSDGSLSSSSSSEETSWARLLEATISGNADQVQEILLQAPELKESIDNLSSATGMNPLHFAASRGHEDIVRILIDQAGAAVDIQDREGETALLKASYSGWFAVVCFLLKRGANVHQRDKDGWTALHNASSRGYIDIAQVLLEKGEADINARSKMGHTPLINAASKGDISMSLYFLNHARANPLLKNSFSESAYDVAAANSEAYLCDILQSSERQWWKAEHTPDQIYDPLSFHNTVLMAVYENQRASGSFPLSLMAPKFSANALTQQDIGGPWSLPNGRPSTKDDVHLPLVSAQGSSSSRNNMQRGWFWLTEWVIDKTDPNVDNEGWQYGKSLTDSNQLWTATAPTSGGNWVRRRKWIRVMKRRMDMITPSEESVSGEDIQELAGNYMKRANLALRPDEPFQDRHQELARYRQAIQVLLRGIKADRDAVSKATATALVGDYLEHAEKLTKSIRLQTSLLEDPDQLETPRPKIRPPSPHGGSGSTSELRSLTLQKSRPSDADSVEDHVMHTVQEPEEPVEDSSNDSFASAANNFEVENQNGTGEQLPASAATVAAVVPGLEADVVPELEDEPQEQELLESFPPVHDEEPLYFTTATNTLDENGLTDRLSTLEVPATDVPEPTVAMESVAESQTEGPAFIPIPSNAQSVPEVAIISPSPAAVQADPFPLARLSRNVRSSPTSTHSTGRPGAQSFNGTMSASSSESRLQQGESSTVPPTVDTQPTQTYTYTNGGLSNLLQSSSSGEHSGARPLDSTEAQIPATLPVHQSIPTNPPQERGGYPSRAQSMQSSSSAPHHHHHYQIHGPLPDARWESDHKATECRECHRKFSLWLRRHHCRRCGHVVCDRCSSHRATLHPSMVVYDPTSNEAFINHQAMSRRGTLQSYRVCDSCYSHLGLGRSNSLGSGTGNGSGTVGQSSSSSSTQIQHARTYHGQTSQQQLLRQQGYASSAPSGGRDDGVYLQSGSGYAQDFSSSSSRSSSSSNLHPSPMVRNASSSSLMAECPVCGAILAGMEGGKAAQEAHVQDCLEGKPGQGSGPINNVRYIVYKLPADSPLIDQECAICFEEFVAEQWPD